MVVSFIGGGTRIAQVVVNHTTAPSVHMKVSRGHVRMVVGFTTTYAISTYHH